MPTIEKIPIVDMEEATHDVSSSIVRLPYVDIADIVSWVLERRPLAIIPPYNQDIRFTARAASYVKDRLPGYPLLVGVADTRPRAVKDSLRILQEGGYTAFALSAQIGDIPLEHLFPVMPEWMWIHVAGRKPNGDLPGKWTWSEEEL